MYIFAKLIEFLFPKHTCLIYTALGYEEYFKIVNKLEGSGITYRAVSGSSLSAPVRTLSPREHQDIPYRFYVKKEDEQKAKQAIKNI